MQTRNLGRSVLEAHQACNFAAFSKFRFALNDSRINRKTFIYVPRFSSITQYKRGITTPSNESRIKPQTKSFLQARRRFQAHKAQKRLE